MKKILITGANSYIGTSFEKWVSQYANKYIVDTLDMKSDKWRGKDFTIYDAVFHVAGIAHVSAKPNMEQLYFKINRDLAIEVANKAKTDGVGQFIFMSSIIIYGDNLNAIATKKINKNTLPLPTNFYGESKLQAETTIKKLSSDKFKTVIIRAPMIYGKDSKGNYKRLSKMARYVPCFPKYENKRSMLYIDNLCELVRLIIDKNEQGVFFPQNDRYISTYEMVSIIREEAYGKRIFLTSLFNPLIKFFCNRIGLFNKVFGSLYYDLKISNFSENYRVASFKESIKRTEK